MMSVSASNSPGSRGEAFQKDRGPENLNTERLPQVEQVLVVSDNDGPGGKRGRQVRIVLRITAARLAERRGFDEADFFQLPHQRSANVLGAFPVTRQAGGRLPRFFQSELGAEGECLAAGELDQTSPGFTAKHQPGGGHIRVNDDAHGFPSLPVFES